MQQKDLSRSHQIYKSTSPMPRGLTGSANLVDIVLRRDMDLPSCSGLGPGEDGDSLGIIGVGSVTLGEDAMGQGAASAGSRSSSGDVGIVRGAC